MRFTFAVLGRDEARWLPNSLGQALAAAGPGDAVLFVDSASRDGSRAVAESLGVRTVAARAGKGNAVAAALAAVDTEYVVLLDADLERSSGNFAATLRDAALRSGADLVLGEFDEPRVDRRGRHTSRFLWPPLVAALFPEAEGVFTRTILTGFRAVRREFPLGELPGGFGVEAHINLAVAAGGGRIEHVDVGTYWGPVRVRQALSLAVGEAVLDLAQSLGRIDPADRPSWDRWVERLVLAIVEAWRAYQDGELEDPGARERARLAIDAAAAHPLPPRRVQSAAA